MAYNEEEQAIADESMRRWNATGQSEPYTVIQYQVQKEFAQKKNAGANKAEYGVGTFSTDPLIQQGQKTGIERAKNVYGQDYNQTGQDVQDIVKMRKERLTSSDPTSTRAREARNRQIRMAKATGASPEELSQINRTAESDIANQEYATQSQALSDYQSLIGNILKGQTGLELGFAGLEKAGEKVDTPSSGGGLGTVICTELYEQGYMSEEVYLLDKKYGEELRKRNPNAYYGYLFLANPVVTLMKRSHTITVLISIPAMAWARNMAGDHNPMGSLISKIGEKFCSFIGRWTNGKLQGSKA